MSRAAPYVEFDVCGPLPSGMTVLEASAGTGKTYTIAALAARYVAEGMPLERLLLITFTRMATGELRDRVRERLVGCEQQLSRILAGAPDLGGDDSRVLPGDACGARHGGRSGARDGVRRERLGSAGAGARRSVRPALSAAGRRVVRSRAGARDRTGGGVQPDGGARAAGRAGAEHGGDALPARGCGSRRARDAQAADGDHDL